MPNSRYEIDDVRQEGKGARSHTRNMVVTSEFPMISNLESTLYPTQVYILEGIGQVHVHRV